MNSINDGRPVQQTTTGLTPEQQAARLFRLTGSTIAAYLGYSPYRRPSQQWLVGMGYETERETPEMAAGNILEPAIITLALHELGLAESDCARSPGSAFHVEHPAAIVVHPDALVPGVTTGIQAKNHNPWVARTYQGRPGATGHPWDNELVPLHHVLQCQLEMEVFRSHGWAVAGWWLAAYFGGADCRCYRIAHDPKLTRGLLTAGLRFWREHLDPAGPQKPATDEHWVGPLKREKPVPRLAAAELRAAPIPFEPDPGPLDIAIPFEDDL
jgi:YqaJ-like viral recombinase domain